MHIVRKQNPPSFTTGRLHTMYALATLALAALLALSGCTSTSSMPLIVANRGGASDAPENTLWAIKTSLANRADALWLSVQLTRDGAPVLYRAANVNATTEGKGAVASFTLQKLQRLNAGYRFSIVDAKGTRSYPYRTNPQRIPTLREALRAIPSSVPVILDMKALPAPRQAAAVARVLGEEKAWSRVTIYSNDAAYRIAFSRYPQARMFEAREATRARLQTDSIMHQCISPPPAGTWGAVEYAKNSEMVEMFAPDEARSSPTAKLWTHDAVACFHKNGATRLVATGIDDEAGYRTAACLGVDAVLADSPRRMSSIRNSIDKPLRCF
jgi:glycerophosphoryl diester phosphodiesterase